MSGGGDTRVSVPNNVRKVVQEIKKALGSKHSEEFVYTTLKDSDMDSNEAGRRLKMIHRIIEIAGKHSVEDVYAMLKDCNMDPNEAAQRLLYIDTFHEVKKKHDRRKTISSDKSEEYKRAGGYQWQGAKGGRGTFYSPKVFNDVAGGINLSSDKEYGVTNIRERVSRQTMPVHGKENKVVHVANSAANVNSTPAITNGSYNHKLAPKLYADVSSSASDLIAVSSQNSNHTCVVGIIKSEIIKLSVPNESNARLPVGMKFSADQVIADTIPVIAQAADSDNTCQLKSDVVEKNLISEPLPPISLLTQNNTQLFNLIQDDKPPQLLNEPLKESELKRSAPKLEKNLEKLTLSSYQPVIFPDHLQVPDKSKIQFTFGSLDATQQNGEVVREPSSSNQNIATRAEEGESQDHPLPHLSENISPSQDNISSDPALKHEQTKLEMMGGFPHPVLQTTRDYTFGFIPHLIGPHYVHVDIPSALCPTQPATLSPPLFPYFRQPYPSYIPYNPYFPHMYMPQNAHLFNHGVFHQSELKFSVPSQYKQGSNVVNLNHLGSYGATVTPGSSANENLTTSHSKDNSLHSEAQQGKDPQVCVPAGGRDLPSLPPDYFYNFHQAGLFHSSDQSHTAGGTVEPTLYQQPQHAAQINRNTAIPE